MCSLNHKLSMHYLIIILIVNVVVITRGTTAKNSTKDVIGFPEIEENPVLKNKDNRQPVYLPSTCPPGELYYPGDQKDDWICDCRPAYIYYPPKDTCFPAYRQGPCDVGQYLILPKNSYIPVCEKNPCYADNYVFWNGKCESLGSVEPCESKYLRAAALNVNATNLIVGCVKLNLENRFGEDIPDVRSSDCLPGRKKLINGKC